MDVSPQERASRAIREDGLSARELRIVAWIMAGYRNKDLARKLGITERMVKYQLTKIFNKVGASNRLELVFIAIDRGLTDRGSVQFPDGRPA